jgi:hypothetical protein
MTRQAAPTATDACCSPATPRTCTRRWAARAQHRRAGCGEPGVEAGAGGQADVPDTCSTPITPSATRSPPRVAQHDGAGRAHAPDDRTQALSDIVSEIVRMDEPRNPRRGAVRASDIRYDLGEGHPLLGRRMPDLDVVVAGKGSPRVHADARSAARAARLREARAPSKSLRAQVASASSSRIRRAVGASGHRSGDRTRRGVDPAGRIRGVGGEKPATRDSPTRSVPVWSSWAVSDPCDAARHLSSAHGHGRWTAGRRSPPRGLRYEDCRHDRGLARERGRSSKRLLYAARKRLSCARPVARSGCCSVQCCPCLLVATGCARLPPRPVVP